MGESPLFREDAAAVGKVIAGRGLRLVYGGGHVGLMGVVADAALQAGGQVLGIIPRALEEREVQHRGLTELRVTGSMHERKAMMAEESDGFIAIAGGFGTLDELCEIVTWSTLGIHQKPIALLNTNGFFDALSAFFDHATTSGFIRGEHRAVLLEGDDPDALLDAMLAWKPTAVSKWSTPVAPVP